MPVDRDSDELKEFIRDHSVKGYPVTVPVFESGKITKQHRPGGGKLFYIICGDKPIPFEKYAEEFHLDDTPLTLEEWKEKEGYPGIQMIRPELQDVLEQGGRISYKDHVFAYLMARGNINDDLEVTCDSFEAQHVSIDPSKLKKGMLVEFSEAGGAAEWPGRFIGFRNVAGDRIALLEVFAPTPFMRAPEAIVPQAIKPGFYSSKTGALGYGTAQAWEEHRGKLPPGKWADDEREYILDDWMDLSRVEDLCEEYFSDHPHCLWQAMMLFIIPLNIQKGSFHPMPEGGDPEEFVVSLDELFES